MSDKKPAKPVKRVQVKLLRTHTHARKAHQPGDVIEVREDQAACLCAGDNPTATREV